MPLTRFERHQAVIYWQTTLSCSLAASLFTSETITKYKVIQLFHVYQCKYKYVYWKKKLVFELTVVVRVKCVNFFPWWNTHFYFKLKYLWRWVSVLLIRTKIHWSQNLHLKYPLHTSNIVILCLYIWERERLRISVTPKKNDDIKEWGQNIRHINHSLVISYHTLAVYNHFTHLHFLHSVVRQRCKKAYGIKYTLEISWYQQFPFHSHHLLCIHSQMYAHIQVMCLRVKACNAFVLAITQSNFVKVYQSTQKAYKAFSKTCLI